MTRSHLPRDGNCLPFVDQFREVGEDIRLYQNKLELQLQSRNIEDQESVWGEENYKIVAPNLAIPCTLKWEYDVELPVFTG